MGLVICNCYGNFRTGTTFDSASCGTSRAECSPECLFCVGYASEFTGSKQGVVALLFGPFGALYLVDLG